MQFFATRSNLLSIIFDLQMKSLKMQYFLTDSGQSTYINSIFFKKIMHKVHLVFMHKKEYCFFFRNTFFIDLDKL